LQAPVRSVLELGAVMGETISFDVLRTASDLAEADLVEYVDRLVRDRIWNRTDGTIAFVHGVIRERTLELIDDDRRERLHARVARAIETVHAGAIQEHYGWLATHYDRAGDDEAAAGYYRQAGDRAADAYAHEDALDCYERAIALSRDRDGTDPTDLAALLADLAEVYRIVGEIDSSRRIATEGIEVAPDGSREACRLLGITADARIAQGAFSPAREATDRQRELAVDLGARDLEARAIQRLGEIAKDRGGFDPAREFYEESLDIFRELDDRESEASVHKELGVVAWRQGEYDRARESLQRGLDIAQELDARQLEAACLNNLGGVAYNQDEYDRAHEFFRRSFGIDREIGSRRDEARSLNNLGLVARRQGEYDRAHAYYERSLDVKREIGDRQGEARTLNNLGVIATKQGEYDRAREYLLESLDTKRDIGDRNGEADSLGNLGLVAYRQGEYDRARGYFERGLDIAREVGDRRRECSALNNLGHAAVGLREYDRARESFGDALELARELGTPAEELRSLRGLGVIGRRQEEYDRATRHLREALEVGADGGDPLELARVRLEWARVALVRGDLESACEKREAAHETFTELGTTHWEGQSHALRGRIAAAAGADEEAREHWRTAVDRFEAIGAPQDALATLRDLVETCREADDDARSQEWCRRARDLLVDAPDPVASRHSQWVDRHEAELEDA
jgi:tetratricopeptide (TPR) repeat protein